VFLVPLEGAVASEEELRTKLAQTQGAVASEEELRTKLAQTQGAVASEEELRTKLVGPVMCWAVATSSLSRSLCPPPRAGSHRVTDRL